MIRVGDYALTVVVLAIAAMLLVPLPTALLDVLLAVNLGFSVLLLLVGLYLPNALALLAFPSLLLLSTLFRLGLNVASCRLILSQGDAGRVIEAFGNFLIRGEVVVGLVIFSIITIVNYIVIAKGSARVSEVAARFALDALPGKQMAIDADLRAGLISSEQAHKLREELRKESQLYGAMDGAMKFVQGDALAGIFIIFANIIGGIYMGVSQGMPLLEASSTYTILTVGDGLVSQIPALLISICAGIVVTRVAASEHSTLARDVREQLFSKPASLISAGVVLCLVGLLPGLPWLPFIMVGGTVAGVTFLAERGILRLRLTTDEGVPHKLPSVEELDLHEDEGLLILELDEGALLRSFEESDEYLDAWRSLQEDFFSRWGLGLPDLKIVNNDSLENGAFRILIEGVPVLAGKTSLNEVLVEIIPEALEVYGLTLVREQTHPINGSRVSWVRSDSRTRKILDAAKVRYYSFVEFVGLSAGAYLIRHPESILSLLDVHGLVRSLEKKYPGVMGDLLTKEFIDVSQITEVVQELLKDGHSMRDFKQILEAVAHFCSENKTYLSQGDQPNIIDVLSFVRQRRRKTLLSKAASERRTLTVISLADEVDELFRETELSSLQSYLTVDPRTQERLHKGLLSLIGPSARMGVSPLNVLCQPEIRCKVQAFLRSSYAYGSVFSLDELEPGVEIEPFGTWGLA